LLVEHLLNVGFKTLIFKGCLSEKMLKLDFFDSLVSRFEVTMDGHEYESLVSSLVTTLVQNTPLRGHEIGTGRQNRIAGASGYRHQIDLTWRHQHSLFLVET
jgi:hypothetical protein